ncbi:uncharacterized protein LOC141606531 isoform X1 [Silene latifolia]|uniref:uncharacterized protein LOC141606531 isoform X1 n=1 Tax=Silene latifolia TaxID=37657 RepID=UPI003D770A3D
MVGFEPELNPILNSGYTILDLLRELEEDCNDDMSTWPVEPHLVNDASMWKPFIKPCYNDDANLSSPVVGSCNTKDDDDDDASSSSRLLKPYHLRGVEDDDYEGCLTTPLIQVFSVRISTYFNDGKPCEISGSIRVLEGSCPCFHLYNRDPKDPQIIWKDGTLSLIGPKESFIVPSLSTKLELRLYDRLRDVELVAGDLSLDSDSDNRLRKAEVKGVHGIAFVDYAVFPFAVNGTVMVTVTKKNNDDGDKNCDAANIYGSIITEYENGRAYCSTDTDVKMLETRLFDKPAHQPLRVVVGTHIPLSRNVVAVPAYSSLTIKLNLWDSNGKIADDSLQYPSYLLGENPKYISTQYACVEVRVRWNDAYCYLYKDRISSSNKPESILKTGKESSGSRHVQPPILPREINPFYHGTRKVDVLSVFVGGIAGKITALCGAIIVNDSDHYFTIYNRDDNCAELLSDNSLASVDVNYRAISSHAFGLILHLWDPVGKLEVSRGRFGWNESTILDLVHGHNRRFCSVVRGDNGYATVHYQMFSLAFEAWVEVKLFFDGKPPDIPINLHGTLFGRCSGEDFSTSYQKKYYMSRLFDQPRDRAVELKSGSKIALLKSIVVVPNKSSLIIEAKLDTFGIDGVAETICGMAEFKIDKCNTIVETIRGERCSIEISVKYKCD